MIRLSPFKDHSHPSDITSCVYPAHSKESRFKIHLFPVLALVPVYHILVQPAPGQQEEQ